MLYGQFKMTISELTSRLYFDDVIFSGDDAVVVALRRHRFTNGQPVEHCRVSEAARPAAVARCRRHERVGVPCLGVRVLQRELPPDLSMAARDRDDHRAVQSIARHPRRAVDHRGNARVQPIGSSRRARGHSRPLRAAGVADDPGLCHGDTLLELLEAPKAMGLCHDGAILELLVRRAARRIKNTIELA